MVSRPPARAAGCRPAPTRAQSAAAARRAGRRAPLSLTYRRRSRCHRPAGGRAARIHIPSRPSLRAMTRSQSRLAPIPVNRAPRAGGLKTSMRGQRPEVGTRADEALGERTGPSGSGHEAIQHDRFKKLRRGRLLSDGSMACDPRYAMVTQAVDGVDCTTATSTSVHRSRTGRNDR